MLGHLVDKHFGHGSVRRLRDYILDFSANYITLSILARHRFDKIDLNIRVNIVSNFFAHGFGHSFVSAGRIAESVIIVRAIILHIIAYDR